MLGPSSTWTLLTLDWERDNKSRLEFTYRILALAFFCFFTLIIALGLSLDPSVDGLRKIGSWARLSQNATTVLLAAILPGLMGVMSLWSEKRDDTLTMLLLANVSPRHIVLARFLKLFIVIERILLIPLPFFVAAHVFAGADPRAAVYWFHGTTLLAAMMCSITLLWSALFESVFVAQFIAFLVAVVLLAFGVLNHIASASLLPYHPLSPFGSLAQAMFVTLFCAIVLSMASLVMEYRLAKRYRGPRPISPRSRRFRTGKLLTRALGPVGCLVRAHIAGQNLERRRPVINRLLQIVAGTALTVFSYYFFGIELLTVYVIALDIHTNSVALRQTGALDIIQLSTRRTDELHWALFKCHAFRSAFLYPCLCLAGCAAYFLDNTSYVGFHFGAMPFASTYWTILTILLLFYGILKVAFITMFSLAIDLTTRSASLAALACTIFYGMSYFAISMLAYTFFDTQPMRLIFAMFFDDSRNAEILSRLTAATLILLVLPGLALIVAYQILRQTAHPLHRRTFPSTYTATSVDSRPK